jgi:hypothetical protein
MLSLRSLAFALLSFAVVNPGAFATSDSCTDSSGYQYSLLSTEVEGNYYVYRYFVTAGTTTTILSHWNVFVSDSCAATVSSTCALGGTFATKEAECTNPIDTSANQCSTRSWKTGTSADIMTFKILKSRVVHPTGGSVTVQSKSGSTQFGSTCPTCQLKGPQCASASHGHDYHGSPDDEPESTYFRLIRSLTVGTKDAKEKEKKESTKDDSKVEELKAKTLDVVKEVFMKGSKKEELEATDDVEDNDTSPSTTESTVKEMDESPSVEKNDDKDKSTSGVSSPRIETCACHAVQAS